MASIRQRHNKFEARVRVPKALVESYGGKELLYKTLEASDRRAAKVEAAAWEALLKTEWQVRLSGTQPPTSARHLYEAIRAQARQGAYGTADLPDADDELEGGLLIALERMEDEIGRREFTPAEQAKVWALNDARMELRGDRPSRRVELEPSFSEVAEEHLRLWRAQAGLKETNTENQKRATINLFGLYFGNRPIRQVSKREASNFVDALRELDPNWARTGKARGEAAPASWSALQEKFGGRTKGLSDNTVNRHVATLSALWNWAEEREYCEGRNPFTGHRRKVQEGRNKHGYLPWSASDLNRLFSPPPKRSDLTEIMLVGLFTGMRLGEIASLTNDQIVEREGVVLIDIRDAKTRAGIRLVPLHPRLQWLADRASKGGAGVRIWSRLRNEGPGGKPSGDIGKEFSRFKASRGFEGERKVFHSFRKNVVGQLERAGIPQNEVAQIVGHEKQGLTFSVYGTKADYARLAEIVCLIDYPDVSLPEPS